MKRYRLRARDLAALVGLTCAAPACNDMDGVGGGIDDRLVGEWIATGWLVVNAQNSSERVDLLLEESRFLRLVLSENGSFAFGTAYPGGTAPTGTWYTSGSSLTLEFHTGKGLEATFRLAQGGQVIYDADSWTLPRIMPGFIKAPARTAGKNSHFRSRLSALTLAPLLIKFPHCS